MTRLVGVMMSSAELDVLDWLVLQCVAKSRSDALRQAMLLMAERWGASVGVLGQARDEREQLGTRQRSISGTRQMRNRVLGGSDPAHNVPVFSSRPTLAD